MRPASDREIGDEIVVDGDSRRRRVDRRRREADLPVALHDGEIHRTRCDARRRLGETLRVRAEVFAPNEEAEPAAPEEEDEHRREGARTRQATSAHKPLR